MAIVSRLIHHLERIKNKPFTGWVGLIRVTKVGESPIKSDHTKMTTTKKLASNMDGRMWRLEVAYAVGYYEISDL